MLCSFHISVTERHWVFIEKFTWSPVMSCHVWTLERFFFTNRNTNSNFTKLTPAFLFCFNFTEMSQVPFHSVLFTVAALWCSSLCCMQSFIWCMPPQCMQCYELASEKTRQLPLSLHWGCTRKHCPVRPLCKDKASWCEQAFRRIWIVEKIGV